MDPGERYLEYPCGAVALVLRTLFRNGYLLVLSVTILDDDADLIFRRVIASIGERFRRGAASGRIIVFHVFRVERCSSLRSKSILLHRSVATSPTRWPE